MNVLIVKNISSEGPGTIEEYLRSEERSYTIVDLNKGESVPDVSVFTHIAVMGGPMAVYEMDKYPFLKDEANLIETAIRSNKHVLGVCLGAQMLAHVLGANVYAGGRKEIGWHHVSITADGKKDRPMSTLAKDGKSTAEVFQWHGDTFDLPNGSLRLASSELFPNQAFRYSDRVYALQFHIEVTPAIVLDWLKAEQGMDLKSVSEQSNKIYEPYRARAMNFYREFFS